MQNTPNSDQDQDKLCHKNLCNILTNSFNKNDTLDSISEIINPLSGDDLARIINMQDGLGLTLLHHAVNKDKPTVIEYLLKKGARCDIKNLNGKTAYDSARFFSNKDDVRNLMDGNTQFISAPLKEI